MTDTKIADALTDHLSRAWDMILAAAKQFPKEQWHESADERMQPARIVYHILMGADRYTWLGDPDTYLAEREFSLDWINAPAQELPGQADAIQHLEEAKAKTLKWVQHFCPSGLIGEQPPWPWTGCCALAQGLYHLRHLQHHMAELNIVLRRSGLSSVDWE